MSRETIAGTGYKWTGGPDLLRLAQERAKNPLEKRLRLRTEVVLLKDWTY